MNKTTSNDMMEREFDILQSIQGLKPPAGLYDSIISKAAKQGMTVSKKWFAGAAALLAVVLCVEVFILLQSLTDSANSNEVETLVQSENYNLYE